MHSWRAGDEASLEHAKYFRFCRLVQRQETGNIEYMGGETESRTFENVLKNIVRGNYLLLAFTVHHIFADVVACTLVWKIQNFQGFRELSNNFTVGFSTNLCFGKWFFHCEPSFSATPVTRLRKGHCVTFITKKVIVCSR